MSSCDSYDCLDVVLENVIMNFALSRDEGVDILQPNLILRFRVTEIPPI